MTTHTERVRAIAATGDDVVRFTLAGREVVDVATVLQGVGAQCVAIDPHDPDRVYVGSFDDGVHVSRDGGTKWEGGADGLIDQRVMSLAVSPSHRGSGISVLYAGTEPSNLYRSEDGGRRWERLSALRELPSEPRWSFPPRPWTHHVRTIALHPTDPNWLAVGIELGGVMRSLDGGRTWFDHNPEAHSDAHQLLTHPLAPHRIYEVAGQGVARSDDRGETWSHVEDGLDRHYAWAEALDPADPDLWYVSVSSGPFAAHGQGDGQSHLWRSRGDGWTAIDDWGAAPELRRMPYALSPLPERPGALLVGLRGGTFLLTGDAGETWDRLEVTIPDVIDFALAPA
ncbi:MAG: WD40/YVTN/BNR-like repeat-containing protein [Candidatus Woesearchaeota archaeon]